MRLSFSTVVVQHKFSRLSRNGSTISNRSNRVNDIPERSSSSRPPGEGQEDSQQALCNCPEVGEEMIARSNLSKYAFIIALFALSRTMVEPEQTLLLLVTLVYMILELVVYPASDWRRDRQAEK